MLSRARVRKKKKKNVSFAFPAILYSGVFFSSYDLDLFVVELCGTAGAGRGERGPGREDFLFFLGNCSTQKCCLPFVCTGGKFLKKKSINRDDASRRDEHEANYR